MNAPRGAIHLVYYEGCTQNVLPFTSYEEVVARSFFHIIRGAREAFFHLYHASWMRHDLSLIL